MTIVHRNFMAIFTNEAVFPLGFDGIRPFSVAGRRVFVYDRGERRITLQEDTPMKIMAIDYGDAHTGIAISDPTGTLAGFSTVINSRKADIVVEEIVRLIAGHGVTELVLGYPKNMDGTLGPRAYYILKLTKILTKGGNGSDSPSRSGTSGAPRSTRTTFSSATAKTPKSARRPSMPSRRH